MGNYKIILVLLSIIGIHSCSNTSNHNPPSTAFKTNPPSRLYFKNMRSINYNSEVMSKQQIDIFRFRKLDEVQNRPIIFPQILDYWILDRAYLKLVGNKAADSILQDTLILKNENLLDTIVFQTNRPEEQTQIVIKIHEALKKKKQEFAITKEGKQLMLLEDKMDRYYFDIIMKDYYRLIDMI